MMRRKVDFSINFPENLRKDTPLSSTPRLAYDDLGDFIEERSKIRRLLDNTNETELKVDYSDFANHVFFDSAVSKYLVAQDRILTKYPYNGSKEEKDAYFLTGSGYENYLFDQWPRYVGYVEFSSSAQFASASDFNKKLVFNTSSLMMSADVNTRQQSGLQNMVCAVSSTQASYLLYFSGTGPSLVSKVNSGSTVATVAVDYSQYVDTWRNVASIVDRDRGLLSLYIDGNKVASQSFTPGPMEQSNVTVYVGGNTAAGYSAYSGALDNVRLYFTASELLLQKNIGKPLDSENYVALNYTFGEGKTFTSSVDVNVIDYSKSGLHGILAGYSPNVRVSGTSRFSDSGTPILYSFHGAVTEFSSSAILSATLYDNNNNNQIFNMLPEGVLIADEQQEGLMAAFSLALARYFDEIKLYIDQFENIRITNYDNVNETPDQFLPFLTRYFGWKVTEHFNDADPLSFFFGEGVKASQQLDFPLVEIRNQFWRRILNNLPYLLKTKGKRYNLDAFFNVIGVNKENINLKEYGYLSEGSLEDTRIHKEKVSAFVGIGTGSLSSSFVRAPGVVSASNNAYTIEAWMQLPYFSSSYANSLSVLTGSVWQMADSGVTSGSYALLWNVVSLGNTQGKFILTGSDGQRFSSSNVEVFDGDFVYVAAGLNQDRTPFISIRTLDNDELDLQSDFSGTTALSGVFTGSKFDFIMGATSGTYFQKQTQGYYGQYKVWGRTLSASEITTHAFDFENVGVMDPTENPNPLRGYWPLNENISASVGGVLSGLQDLSRNDRVATGSNFPTSYNPYKKFLVEYNTLSPSFDLRWTENKIRVRNKSELTIDDVAHDTNEVSLEFNLVDSLNKDISKIFATFDLFNNAIGNPINKYRDEYADLEAYRRVYFERLGDSLHFNQFFGLFKWFDKKISDAIKQLLPARVRFIGGEQVIESHALERPRYQYKYPIFRTPVDLPNIDLSGALQVDGKAMESYESALPAMGTSARTHFELEKINSLKGGLRVSPRYSSTHATATTPFAKKDVKSLYNQGGSLSPVRNGLPAVQFSFLNYLSSIDNLSMTMTANSINRSPHFRFEGKNAISSASWIATTGSDLILTGSGNNQTLNRDTPFLNSVDKAVYFSGSADSSSGKAYMATTSSYADLSTEDFVIEMVFRQNDSRSGTPPRTLMSKCTPVLLKGWSLIQSIYEGADDSRDLAFYIQDGSGGDGAYTAIIANRYPIDSAWYHVLVFVDRSETSANGLRMYLNGQYAVTDTLNGANFPGFGSILNSGSLKIGSGDLFGNGFYLGDIAYASMWQGAGWFAGGATNQTEWGKIAETRFAQLNGTYPSSGNVVAVSGARGHGGYLQKVTNGTGSLFLVGQNWPRVSQEIDVSGTVFTGYLSETGSLNKFDYPCTYDHSTAWMRSGSVASTLAISSTVSPWGFQDATFATFSGAGGTLSQLPPNVFSGSIFTFSTYIKASGAVPQVAKFYVRDLVSATTQSFSATLTTNEWARPSFTFTTPRSSSLFEVGIGGENTVFSAHIWGSQMEGQVDVSSFIPVVLSGTNRRDPDYLHYSASFPASASITMRVLTQNISQAAFMASKTFIDIGGGTSANVINVGGAATTGKPTASVVSGSNTAYTSSGVGVPRANDGKIHSLGLNYAPASFVATMDGVDASAVDTSGLPPDVRDKMWLGMNNYAFRLWARGLVGTVSINDLNVEKPTFTPLKTSGDTSVDSFAHDSDINSRNAYVRKLLQNTEQSSVTDVGNLFAVGDYNSSKNQEHYFGGTKKHYDLKLMALSGNAVSGTLIALTGAVGAEFSSTLMDLNNVLIISAGGTDPYPTAFDVTDVFGFSSGSGHDLASARLRFSVSSSVGAFSSNDIRVEFRDLSSSDWSSYVRIERLGTYISSSDSPGWIDFEYNFAKNGKVAIPKMSYINTSPFVRLSSSTAKLHVFRNVRVEFRESLTDDGVTFYERVDNQRNKNYFTYLNEKVMKDVEG